MAGLAEFLNACRSNAYTRFIIFDLFGYTDDHGPTLSDLDAIRDGLRLESSAITTVHSIVWRACRHRSRSPSWAWRSISFSSAAVNLSFLRASSESSS